ncbi:MAG: nitronate monooxygenase family protein [Andreesenia angusta]|nr:nitronate monooxygenase family protein [Andreesenia angusta]
MNILTSKMGKLEHPIIQGGMGVGISLGELAGAVAREGCMGVISMVNIGYREDDFYRNPFEANKRAFKKELLKARDIAKGKGMVAVNIMAALSRFSDFVELAVKEKVDAVIVGAGLPLNLPSLVETKDVLIAPIVSSRKALDLIMRTWKKKYDRLPDFVVLEGKEAGGHLGFKEKDFDDDEKNLENLTIDLVDYLKGVKEKYDLQIPLFVGGSVFDNEDLKKYNALGATGLQIGSRFIATEECDASIGLKEMIIDNNSENLSVFISPVGMPGRGIENNFIRRVKGERVPSKSCVDCIKKCNPKVTPYCISDALISAAKGDKENGLFFCGANIDRINKMSTVKEVISDILGKTEDV